MNTYVFTNNYNAEYNTDYLNHNHDIRLVRFLYITNIYLINISNGASVDYI